MSGTPDPAQDDTSHLQRTTVGAMLLLALPNVVTYLSRTVMGFVDFGMVSVLSTEAQAAITPAGLSQFCLIAFGMGLVGCVNTFASQALGRENESDASAYAWQAVFISILIGVASLLLWPVAETLFSRFGHEPAVRALEVEYFTICLLSIGPTLMAASLANFFIGIHRPNITMWSALGANVFNIGANYVLIFGKLGFEPMGIAGAAWGTVLATIFRAAWLLVVFCAARTDADFGSRRTMAVDPVKTLRLLRIGLPAAAHAGMELAGWTLFVMWLVGQFGTQELAATNIVFQYLHISFMPAVGFGMTITAVVGRAIGQRDFDEAVRHVRIGARIIMAYMATMGLVFFLFGGPMVRLFNSDDAIVAIGARVMICVAIFQAFDGMCIAYTAGLRGAGDTLWTAAALMITFWVIGLAGGYALSQAMPDWRGLGPWIAGTAYIMVLGLLLRWRWKSQRWRSIDIFQSTPNALPQAETEQV